MVFSWWLGLPGEWGVLVQNNFTHSLGMAGRVGLAETIYGPEHLYVASPRWWLSHSSQTTYTAALGSQRQSRVEAGSLLKLGKRHRPLLTFYF